MAPVWMFLIVFAVVLIALIVWAVKTDWKYEFLNAFLIILVGLAILICLIIGITQSVQLKNDALRQAKERDQIIYQIDNMTEETDKIKLNEWILTYNDWVNDVNANKEAFGWFSWYWSLDMSEHKIINLV